MSRWTEGRHGRYLRMARKVGVRWLAFELGAALFGAAYLGIGLTVALCYALRSLVPLVLWVPILLLFAWSWRLPRELWRQA